MRSEKMATTDEQKARRSCGQAKTNSLQVLDRSGPEEEEYQHILESVKEVFADVLSSGEGSSDTTSYSASHSMLLRTVPTK